MPVGSQGRNAPARGALQVALLNQVRLDHVFNGVALFANAGGNVVQADRAAIEAVNHGLQQFAVHQVKALRVDIEHGQGLVRHVLGDAPVAFDLGIVAHPAQQAVGNAGRAARAARDFKAAFHIDGRGQQAGAAHDNALQLFGGVKLQARHNAKTVAQRVGQHAGSGGRADQGEGLQVELDAACRRTFANHDVDLVVLQGRVENFFHHWGQPMDFIDEQHIVFFQAGEQGGQVFGLFQHRPTGLAQVHAELVGDDVAQGGFAQTGWSKQEHMVQGFAALAGRANENLELLAHFHLPHILLEQLGTQGALDRLFIGRHRRRRHHTGRGSEIVSLNAHGGRRKFYLARAFSASLMPSLTPTSVGKALRARAASRSL